MSRARGKHDTGRTIRPGTPEGDDIGLSDRELGTPSPIPGGDNHIANHPTVRQAVPVADPKPEYRGVMAHGVPPGISTTRERAEHEQGPNTARGPQPKYLPKPGKAAAVPVTIVTTRTVRSLASDSFTVPAQGTEAIRIAGRDYDRTHILLLVETAAGTAGAAPTGIRFDHEVGNLDAGKGALLRAGGTSYLKLDCNDELFAVSNDGSAVTLSVIFLYKIAETG